jgi:hypothetical protein
VIHGWPVHGGLPIAFHLTGGEASDSRNFETLLDIGPDIRPRAALGDKGYDAKANREAARRRGICPAIPYRSNVAAKPAFFPKTLYKGRARIEQAVGKIKRFKRVVLRCEKTARKLRVVRGPRLLHLDQIRPHGLEPTPGVILKGRVRRIGARVAKDYLLRLPWRRGSTDAVR